VQTAIVEAVDAELRFLLADAKFKSGQATLRKALANGSLGVLNKAFLKTRYGPIADGLLHRVVNNVDASPGVRGREVASGHNRDAQNVEITRVDELGEHWVAGALTRQPERSRVAASRERLKKAQTDWARAGQRLKALSQVRPECAPASKVITVHREIGGR
jgi:hypothetical protein